MGLFVVLAKPVHAINLIDSDLIPESIQSCLAVNVGSCFHASPVAGISARFWLIAA